MPGFVSGERTTYDDQDDHIIDLAKGIAFLHENMLDTAFIRKIGLGQKSVSNTQFFWTETALAVRGEVITIDDSSTTLTVANARQYVPNTLLRTEAELLLVTAQASATTLTVTRGFGGTTAAAHSAKLIESLGPADPENFKPTVSITDTSDRYYNYVQTFSKLVEISNDEIAQLTTESGNILDKQVERRLVEMSREITKAAIYGIRSDTTGQKRKTMGGLTSFISTNAQNVGAALTLNLIEQRIVQQIRQDANPNIIALAPEMYLKLAALDTQYQHIGKDQRTAGSLVPKTWQSAASGQDLEIIVDTAFHDNELFIGTSSTFEIPKLSNNGVNGTIHIENADEEGRDGKKRVMRGKYSTRLKTEKSWAWLYNITG